MGKIKNVFTGEKFKEISHNGVGELVKIRPFNSGAFETPIDFIDYVIMPPSSEIGLHTHKDDEEIYFILKGEGEMILEDDTFPVKAGDVIINGKNGKHALKNATDRNIEVFIFQVSEK